jgi:hypothetical protein
VKTPLTCGFCLNSRVCTVLPVTEIWGQMSRHIMFCQKNHAVIHVAPLPTPVFDYKSLAWSPLPRPCVEGCSKPLRTFHHVFLVPFLRADQNGKFVSTAKLFRCVSGGLVRFFMVSSARE